MSRCSLPIRGRCSTWSRRCWRCGVKHPALAVGEIAEVEAQGDVLVYERSVDGERLVVALNLSDAAASVTLREWMLCAPPFHRPSSRA